MPVNTKSGARTQSKRGKSARPGVEIPVEALRAMHRNMLRTRRLDEKMLILLKQGKSFFHIGAAGHEAVRIREVQPSGKRRMDASEWIRGRGVKVGDRFT